MGLVAVKYNKSDFIVIVEMMGKYAMGGLRSMGEDCVMRL